MNMTTEQVIADGQKYVMNTYGRLPMVIDRGEGCYVWDLDGNRYLDLVAGIAVNSLGHCHPAVVKAIQEQSEKLMHCSNLYWIENQVALAKLLVEKKRSGQSIFSATAVQKPMKLLLSWRGNGAREKNIISSPCRNPSTAAPWVLWPPLRRKNIRRRSARCRKGFPLCHWAIWTLWKKNPAGNLRHYARTDSGGKRHQCAQSGIYAGCTSAVQKAWHFADCR